MFYTSAFNSDLSNWQVSRVTTLQSTFEAAYSFNGDVSTWEVSLLTNMQVCVQVPHMHVCVPMCKPVCAYMCVCVCACACACACACDCACACARARARACVCCLLMRNTKYILVKITFVHRARSTAPTYSVAISVYGMCRA